MNIYIVDQNKKIAQAIKAASRICVIDDPVKALTVLSACASGIVFLNYDLLQQQSPAFIHGLLQYNDNLQIIVVADDISDAAIIECVMAGAKGYQQLALLSKYADKLIRVIKQGEAWLSRRLVARLINHAVALKSHVTH